jgi:hypothetical protein
MRDLYFTDEFLEFINTSNENVKTKIGYIFGVVKTQSTINTKFIKRLTNTEFYEMRVQVGNEYRVLVFAIDNDNINQCKRVLFLNGFMKKSTKDYDKEIKKAIKILDKWNVEK